MFGTIRKHQTWLWAIIITLTIISFVIFFSPYSKLNPGMDVQLGSINGKRVTEEQFIHGQREAMLHYFFMSNGRWPDQESKQMGYDLERETYQWMLLKQKIDQLGIHIAPDMVAQVARDMLGQFQRAGISSAQAFQEAVLKPRGFNLADFERFVRNYLAIQELVNTFGASGRLVNPNEAKALWVRENQEVATEAVFFSAANYLTKVNPTPEAISQFYSNRLAQYRIPERVQVKYVEFPASNHLAMAEAELSKTNLNEIIDTNMDRLGTNYLRYGSTPDEAKKKIREEIVNNRALIEARRNANEFASLLIDKEQPKLEDFEAVAQAKGLTVQLSAPFDRRDGPKDMAVGQNFPTVAFGLNSTNDLFGGPVVGEKAVHVLAYGGRVPSEIPSLDSIRDRVTADYRQEQAIRLARQAGMAFHSMLTNAMAQGKDFASVVTESGNKLVTLPPVSIGARTLPGLDTTQVSLNELKQLAFSLQPGEVSNFQSSSQGGLILHVKAKLPIDETKLAADLPEFTRFLRQNRVTEAFNEWFRKEAASGLRDTPLERARPAPTMSGAPGAKS